MLIIFLTIFFRPVAIFYGLPVHHHQGLTLLVVEIDDLMVVEIDDLKFDRTLPTTKVM